MTGFLAELPEGEFSLSDELITAQWFDENEVSTKFKGSSVCDRLFGDIKGEKLEEYFMDRVGGEVSV